MEDFSKIWFGSIPQRATVQNTANFRRVGLPETVFAYSVAHTLRALLRLDPRTERTNIVFVRCVSDVVDMAYRAEQDTLCIHEK